MKCATLACLSVILSYSGTYGKSTWKPIGYGRYEVVESDVHGDTLTVVSTADFIYYPFGNFHSEASFEREFRNAGFIRIDSVNLEKEALTAYIIATGKDSVKYFQIDRVGDSTIELISASWHSPRLKMVNGIKTGASKGKVFETFFMNAKPKHYRPINVLEMVSGLTGMWHVYIFDGDRLVKVELKSDYKIASEK